MSEPPFLLLADLHYHKWSAFASVTPDGVNSRLQIQIDETKRAAAELRKRGGRRIIIAGDIFHTRGSITPEVFNPVHKMFAELTNDVFRVDAIPGNHDLTSEDTTELGSAIQTLDSLPNFKVINIPLNIGGVVFLPWYATRDHLRKVVEKLYRDGRDKLDLVCHVGIDSVLPSIPDAGLSPNEVASWGFRRVFAGHYHNHKVMEDGKVVSIGATTHQTWNDINTKAGYVFVYPDHIEYQASHAPSFVEIDQNDEPDEYPLIVDGNYVRVRGLRLTDAQIKQLREGLMEMNAKGVHFQVTRETVSERGASVVGKAATLDESIDKYIDTMTDIDIAAVKAESANVLAAVRSVSID